MVGWMDCPEWAGGWPGGCGRVSAMLLWMIIKIRRENLTIYQEQGIEVMSSACESMTS